MRDSTHRDYGVRIERVQAKIAQDLSSPLQLEDLAKLSGLSLFHFHRVFRAFCGETVRQQIRRVRLERAALLLRHSDRSVTDVALAVGYESPAAFSRAFEQIFDMPPSVWRRASGQPLPRSRESPRTVPAIAPQCIESRRPARVLFVRRHGPYFESAPAAWAALMKSVSWRIWLHFPSEMIGLCHDDPDITAADQIRYDACIHLRRAFRPEGELGEQVIAGGRYAVFLHRGPLDQLSETYDSIYGGWLPSSQEVLGEAPAFEIYLDHPERTKPEKLRTLIHVPLQVRGAHFGAAG